MVIVTEHHPLSGLTDEDLLVALANTGHGTDDDLSASDELRDAASAQRGWRSLAGAAGPARFGTPEDMATLRSARAVIRHLALRNNGVEVKPAPGVLGDLPLRFVLDNGPTLIATGRSTPARGLAARVVVALIRVSAGPAAPRFKACPGPGCGWVFRDVTRNGSRRWCDMAGCGNRAKAAAFRARGR